MKSVRGIVMIMLAISFFAAMSGFIKAAGRVPAGQAVFFRSAFALPIIAIWLSARGDLAHGLRAHNWHLHLARGVAGTLAMGLGFAGLRYLPFPEVTALRFITPILLVIFAALFLGERFRMVRLGAVLMGLCGVLIILWPRLEGALIGGGDRQVIGVLIVLTSASFAAVAQIFIKRMAGIEKTASIVFNFTLISLILSLLTLPLGWVWPTATEAALLISAGLVGGIGQMLLTGSYQFADASALAPFTYVSMIWAIVIGYFIFGEVPTWQMLAGATMIILSGVAIVLRERALGLRK